MIVSLDELKRVVGIDLDDASEDENLTRLILAKTAWVEGKTHRRFDTPIHRVEYHEGRDEAELYLEGHVDDSPDADNPSETLDPTTSVRVFRRPIAERERDWEELTEGEDWERRKDMLLFIRMWNVWPSEDEIKVEYLDGWVHAPEDIREVVLELCLNQYLIDVTASSGTAGITSEKLGDYSYNVDLGAIATGSGSLSETSFDTLNRWKRKFV